MKKIISFVVVLFLLLFTPVTVFAQEKSITVSEDEIIDQNPYFAAGDTVHISGTILGDAYVAGGTVTIDGTIDGDLLVAGGTVRITGKVTNDLRAVAGQIIIDGIIGGNVTSGSGNIDISEDSSIGGYLLSGAGDIYLAGPIGASAYVGGGIVSILSDIPGDLYVSTENLRLGPDSSVGGNLTYWSDTDADIQKGATISGEITKNKVDTKDLKILRNTERQVKQGLFGAKIAGTIFGVLSALVIGFIFLKIYPRYSELVVKTITEKPWKSLGIGFASLFLFPIAFTFLLVTVIGIPLALILLAGYLVYIYTSKILFMLWVGAKISPKASSLMKLFLGVVLFYLVSLLPLFGGILTFFAILFGFGALLISMKSVYKDARKKNVI